MIFYCSPTKTLSKSNKEADSSILFKEHTQVITDKLKQYDANQLKALYQASDKIVNHQYEVIKNPQPLGPSGYVYQGASFKSLDLSSIDNNYLDSRLFIGSALYGLTKINTLIDDHRLDFTKNLDEINLVNYWKPVVQDYLKRYDSILIDVSSKEYGQLISDLNPIKVSFYDDGKIKSTYAKSARGEFLRQCALNKVDSIHQLKELTIFDYQVDQNQSTHNHIVFWR